MTRDRAPASVVAAGIVAVIGGGFSALSIAGSFLIISRSDFSLYGLAPTSAMRSILYLTWAFFLVCAGFLVVSGFCVIRLHNWARLSLLVMAGGGLLFGAVGLGFTVLTIYSAPDDPVVSRPLLLSVLAFTYGLPVLAAVWWLVLFTRRPVVEQFRAASAWRAAGRASRPIEPDYPLAVRAVGWYLASFVLFLPFLPFLPSRLPALYFGHLFRGPSAILAHFLSFALCAVPGVGLLLRKRWGYLLAMGGQLLFCANGLAVAFSPSFAANMRASYVELGLPLSFSASLTHMRFLVLLSLALPVAILVILTVYRRPFYAAAERKAPSG